MMSVSSLALKIVLTKYIYKTKSLNLKNNNQRSKLKILVLNRLEVIE